jgi:hypothetical protein
MHVVTFIESKEGGNYDDYTLISGKEAKDPYMITHLIREDGRTLSIGAVENLFEAQWMENHTAKTIKDHLDLASKMIFQTSDGSFVGQNVLSAIEQGDILIHQPNAPLTQINNRADIAALQAQGAQWKQIGNEITGISEAMLGANPKSGTAWRQTEALLQESHNLFEIMAENKGLAIEEMMRSYIIPHLKKKMDTTEEITAILEDHQINQLDAMYVPNEAIRRVNEKIKEAILSGKMFTREEQEAGIELETSNIKDMLAGFGNQRFISPSDIDTKTWKEVMKDLEWDVIIDITGEAQDTQAMMTTLTTVLQTLAANPMVLDDPRMKLLFNRILETAGNISPIELASLPKPEPQQPVMPAGGGQQQVGAGTQPVEQLATT